MSQQNKKGKQRNKLNLGIQQFQSMRRKKWNAAIEF